MGSICCLAVYHVSGCFSDGCRNCKTNKNAVHFACAAAESRRSHGVGTDAGRMVRNGPDTGFALRRDIAGTGKKKKISRKEKIPVLQKCHSPVRKIHGSRRLSSVQYKVNRRRRTMNNLLTLITLTTRIFLIFRRRTRFAIGLVQR